MSLQTARRWWSRAPIDADNVEGAGGRRIDVAAERAAAELGLDPRKVEDVWRAVERLYATGLQPAITLVIRRHGQVVIKRSIGSIGAGANAAALTPDTPICLFSASKSISALLIHKLVEDGKLSLDDRVAAYIPEFSAHGKHRVTLRELLCHRAGIPTFAVEAQGAELLRNWDLIVALLCAAKPFDPRFEKQAYHALTAGFIVGEVVRRVGKIELPEALQQWITGPLQLHSMQYGIPRAQRSQVPPNVVTGMRPIWPMTAYIRSIIGVDFEEGVRATNEEPFLSSVVPAGNLFASADDVSRVFQMLLEGGSLDGVRVFRPETVRAAIEPFGPIQIDRTIRLPLRFSAGFMLGENPVGLYGPDSGAAFGHLGFTSVLAWADPRRAISVALLTTGKSLAPAALLRVTQVLHAIGRAFPSV